MDAVELLKILSGGADAATILLALAIYKIDKRLYTLEMFIEYMKKGKR